MPIRKLDFKPLVDSKHLQMILATYTPGGRAPPSTQQLVDIGNGDQLSCEVSTPPTPSKTVLLIHGLGGSHRSRYMIRMARKLYSQNIKVVRMNLRGCGSGKGLSKLPYNAGNSQDILQVLHSLKNEDPNDIVVVGFSLGASLALKLAGELGPAASSLVTRFVAICPPYDLEHTALTLCEKKNYFYNQYYLKQILKQATPWTSQKFPSLLEFDEAVTSPLWGFEGAKDYYRKCSSRYFLDRIAVTTHILSAEDDPFTSTDLLHDIPISPHVHIWTTEHGSHMGFLGRTKFQWADDLLLSWIT